MQPLQTLIAQGAQALIALRTFFPPADTAVNADMALLMTGADIGPGATPASFFSTSLDDRSAHRQVAYVTAQQALLGFLHPYYHALENPSIELDLSLLSDGSYQAIVVHWENNTIVTHKAFNHTDPVALLTTIFEETRP